MARNDFETNYLAHHGVLGMKWGIRRYQNEDGSLTAAGRERYGVKEGGSINDISSAKGIKRRLNDVDKAIARNKAKRGKALSKVSRKNWNSQNTKNAEKAEKHTEMIKKGEAETEKLLQKAAQKGYEVSSRAILRNVSSGTEIIGRTLLTSALATGMLLPFGRTAFIPSWSSVPGKKYNVKDESEKDKKEAEKLSKKTGYGFKTTEEAYNAAKLREGKNLINKEAGDGYLKDSGKRDRDIINKYSKKYDGKKISDDDLKNNYRSHNKDVINKASSKGLSEKTIKSRVEYAKNTGKFDMEFLERIDRYVDEENHSQAEVLKGYEKYLKEHGDEFYKKK